MCEELSMVVGMGMSWSLVAGYSTCVASLSADVFRAVL